MAPATFAAFTIAVGAVGCLNGLILATGELGYSMALRGDMPTAMGCDPRRQHAGRRRRSWARLVSALVLLANNSRATASLYTFIILLGTASVVIVYFAGACELRLEAQPGLGRRLVLAFAFLFAAFASTGSGWKPCCGRWCCSPSASDPLRSCTGSIRASAPARRRR